MRAKPSSISSANDNRNYPSSTLGRHIKQHLDHQLENFNKPRTRLRLEMLTFLGAPPDTTLSILAKGRRVIFPCVSIRLKV